MSTHCVQKCPSRSMPGIRRTVLADDLHMLAKVAYLVHDHDFSSGWCREAFSRSNLATCRVISHITLVLVRAFPDASIG